MTDHPYSYYCYRCGGRNTIQADVPKAPDFTHIRLVCEHCGDKTNVLLSGCPDESCNGYAFWINDLAIPDLVKSLAKYFVQNLQTVIDSAAMRGFNIGIDTTENFTLRAKCSCGSPFTIDIPIPDLD
jgi:hypothetical protein